MEKKILVNLMHDAWINWSHTGFLPVGSVYEIYRDLYVKYEELCNGNKSQYIESSADKEKRLFYIRDESWFKFCNSVEFTEKNNWSYDSMNSCKLAFVDYINASKNWCDAKEEYNALTA